MMQVFFGPATSEYGLGENPDGRVVELVSAIDVFADTELITNDDAEAAKRSFSAGEWHFPDGWQGNLRAV
ncbi:hypothetical protein [Gordonia neofelifaecis]|uniref:Uncharacterized protein n=1 Tax=Gordonia neofelifaecis NRRL B-59395 TaxID=644548 RepID=F1YHI8_9ACTN|nr:hypothetical protein [Gordonia neofelifaecis]EGD55826.1 hypothetical protein SCNU_06280 [Gordonia neofelifaecis NRRL B-59395]